MKQVIMITALLLSLFSCCREKTDYYNTDGTLISQQQAIDLTEDIWNMYDVAFISHDIIKPKSKFEQNGYEEPYYSPDYQSWCIVAYLTNVNGTKIYHYFFVNAKTGDIYTDGEGHYFYTENYKWNSVKIWGTPPSEAPSQTRSVVSPYEEFIVPDIEPFDDDPRDDKYAVIISGGGNAQNNYVRYWNDCAAIFSVLVNTYHYYKSSIYLLVSDGTSSDADVNLHYYDYYDYLGTRVTGPIVSSPLDYDGDGVAESNIYPATKSSLQSVFSTLSSLVDHDNDLFVFVCDHGDLVNNTSYICLWNNELLSPTEFNTELNKIHNDDGCIHIVMGQCHSGGFVNSMNRDNLTITTACAKSEVSFAAPDGLYDEFLYHWMGAMNGAEVDDSSVIIDADNDALDGISFKDAFDYAVDEDSWNETPQYRSNPSVLGEICTLGSNQIGMLSILGPDNISNATSGQYSIQNMPSGGTVTWVGNNDVSYSSPSSSTTNAYSTISTPYKSVLLNANVSVGLHTFHVTKPVILWGVGIYDVDDELITGEDGCYEYWCPPGAYGFTWDSDNDDWIPQYQGYRYIDFDTNDEGATSVWCSYYTPTGNYARVVREL